MGEMSRVTCQISVSLDGFAAGPDQSLEDPIGKGGMRLHDWAFSPDRHPVDARIADAILDGVGAYVMGRRMFGGGEGPWDEGWRGWWGEDPPYHAPVFVLTHHARAPLAMEGETMFHFVTEGLQSALAQARAAAGDLDVAIAGGASTVRQCLAAGHLDELYLHIVPILLGAGERLLDGAGDPELEPVEVLASPAATHVRYRVG
jgi:dihydrofolate reductase